jgi:SAM-dependent methyltransferase
MPTVQQLYGPSPPRPAPLRSAFRLADRRAVRRAPADGRRRRAAPAHVGRGGGRLKRHLRIDVNTAAAEALPFEDGSVDWIWCRDVLVHVDVPRALAEFARVLRPGGAAVVYVTLPTDRLEPQEAERLAHTCALTGYTAEQVEAAAHAAGLALRSVDRLGTEWRESMIESGIWDTAADLLALVRLDRRREALVEQYGEAAVDAAWGGLVWGVYQVLGKLCPTVYVWTR